VLLFYPFLILGVNITAVVLEITLVVLSACLGVCRAVPRPHSLILLLLQVQLHIFYMPVSFGEDIACPLVNRLDYLSIDDF
jgi:hypothetical protein